MQDNYEIKLTEDTLHVNYEQAVISADFESMRTKLDEMIEPYKGLTPEIVAQMPYQELKDCRRDLNALSKDLNDARKAIKREYNKPLNEFELKVKELDNLILEPLALIKTGIAKIEDDRKMRMYDHLFNEYLAVAGVLAEKLPFDQIFDQKWYTKEKFPVKAEEELFSKVETITKDWNVLKQSTLHCPVETELKFFETLSLQIALEFDHKHAEELQKLNALKAEVEPVQEPIEKPLYRFTLTVPTVQFHADIETAQALKNALVKVGIPYQLKKSQNPVKE